MVCNVVDGWVCFPPRALVVGWVVTDAGDVEDYPEYGYDDVYAGVQGVVQRDGQDDHGYGDGH